MYFFVNFSSNYDIASYADDNITYTTEKICKMFFQI